MGGRNASMAGVYFLLVLCACYNYAEGTDYTVGDKQQWGIGVNYTTWASSKSFVVGDTLVFEYSNASHNVMEVKKSAYESCLATNPTKEYTDGNTSISLTSAGTRYFICGVTGHCGAGMKVAVTVSAGAAQSPSTDTAPIPVSAGHVSVMRDVMVFLVASLLMSLILA